MRKQMLFLTHIIFHAKKTNKFAEKKRAIERVEGKEWNSRTKKDVEMS